jgi:replicative DNA helicase
MNSEFDLDFFNQHGYKHISKSAEKAQEMMDKVRSGEIKPLVTSIKKEQEHIGGFLPGEQVVLAGRTGGGKSAKMFHDMMDFANPELNPTYAADLLILLDSYEMLDWRVVLRLASRKGSAQVKELLDYHKRLTEERFQFLRSVMEQFKNVPIFISNRALNVKNWEETKKQVQGKYPKKRILNIFDHTRLGLKEKEQKEEELITGFMLAGMRLKNSFDQWQFFLSQMNRNIETGANREKLGQHLPVSSDIFGSDAVFQCADVVMALHRPGQYGLTEFEGMKTGLDPKHPEKGDDLLIECVLKQREGWTGSIVLKHNLALNRIEDYPEKDSEFNLLLKDDF